MRKGPVFGLKSRQELIVTGGETSALEKFGFHLKTLMLSYRYFLTGLFGSQQETLHPK